MNRDPRRATVCEKRRMNHFLFQFLLFNHTFPAGSLRRSNKHDIPTPESTADSAEGLDIARRASTYFRSLAYLQVYPFGPRFLRLPVLNTSMHE